MWTRDSGPGSAGSPHGLSKEFLQSTNMLPLELSSYSQEMHETFAWHCQLSYKSMHSLCNPQSQTRIYVITSRLVVRDDILVVIAQLLSVICHKLLTHATFLCTGSCQMIRASCFHASVQRTLFNTTDHVATHLVWVVRHEPTEHDSLLSCSVWTLLTHLGPSTGPFHYHFTRLYCRLRSLFHKPRYCRGQNERTPISESRFLLIE